MKNNKPPPPKSSPSAVKKPGNVNPNNRSTNNPPPPAGRGNTNTNTNQNQASRQPSRQNANNARSPPPNNNNNNRNNNSRNTSPAPGLRRTQSNTQQSGSSTRTNPNTNANQNQNQNQRGISPRRTNSGGRVNQNNTNRNQNQNQNQTNRTSQTKNLNQNQNQNQNRNQNQNTNQKPANRSPVFVKGQPQRQQSQTKGKPSAPPPARQASNKNVTFGKNSTSPARQSSKQNVQSPARQTSKERVKSPVRQNSKEKVKSPARQTSRGNVQSPARQNSRSRFASPKKQGSRENVRSPVSGPGPSSRNRDKSGGKNVDRRSRSAGSIGTRSRSTDSRGSFGVRSRNSSKDSRGSRGSKGPGSSHGSKTSLRSSSSKRSNSSFRDRGRERERGRSRGRDVKSPKRSSSSTSTDRRGPRANRDMRRRTRSDPGDPYRYRGHRGHRSHYGRDPNPYEYPYDHRYRHRSWSRSGSGGSFSSLKKRRSRSRSNSPMSRRSPRGSRSSRSSKSSKGSRVSFSKDTKKGESKRGKRSANRLEKKKGQEELPPVKKLDHIVQAEVGARIWHGLRLNSAHHGNYIISPCFIIIMMGLMKVGAWGKTAYEIQKSMRLPKDDDTNIEAFETFIYSLQPTEGFDLKYGLGIYSSKTLMFRTPYDEDREKDWPWIAKQKFNVRIKQYDYTKKKPQVIKDLNQWVQDITDLKIKYAVSYDDVHNQPELFLVNFVYFKAVWKYVFDVDQTAMKPFYNYDNTFYNVEMMLTYINCRYAVYEDFKCRAVALPYKGDRYAMIIILPDQRTGLPDIEKLMYNLERKYHYRWKREIVPGPRDYYWRDYYKNYRMYKPFFMEIYYRLRHVHWLEVELPKFKVESKTNFVPVLQWLGTRAIFDPVKSQLGGIFEKTSKIAVDKIIQKVLIEVTEEGTGSTAVPTSRLGPTGRSFAKPVNAAFHVNHPFLFFIVDERYHAILMCGTKTNFQL